MKRFITALLITALVCALASWAAFSLLHPVAGLIVPSYAMIGVFCVLTFGFGYLLYNTGMKKPDAFVRTYMSSTALRLLLYLATLITFILMYKEWKVELVIVFFSLYAIMTVVEKVFVVNAVREQLNASGKSD